MSFHSFKLVSMIYNALEPESGWPTTIIMVAKEMLKFGYKLRQNLKAIGHKSPTLIELSDNRGRFNLGYEPTHEEIFQASKGKKRKCTTSRMSIPHIRTTFRLQQKSLCQNLSRNWKTGSLIRLA